MNSTSAFDDHLATHIKSLYRTLKDIYIRSQDMVIEGHECDCEYCDREEDRELKVGYEQAYKDLVEESQEIATTLKRCLSWAEFKKIPVDTKGMHINMYRLEEWE